MADFTLMVSPAYGDETIAKLRYALYAAETEASVRMASTSGLEFYSGQPLLSSDLVATYKAVAGAPTGAVMVYAIPQELGLGHSIFSGALIDRETRQVSGAPIRYTGARRYLGLYPAGSNLETARSDIEDELLNGKPLADLARQRLEPRSMIGRFPTASGFAALLRQVEVTAEAFGGIDLGQLQAALQELFVPSVPANAVYAQSAVRSLLIATIESVVVARLRLLRWQGLALLGYGFTEGEVPMSVPAVASMQEHTKLLDGYEQRLATSSLFAGDLAWLNGYVKRQLAKIRVELNSGNQDDTLV